MLRNDAHAGRRDIVLRAKRAVHALRAQDLRSALLSGRARADASPLRVLRRALRWGAVSRRPWLPLTGCREDARLGFPSAARPWYIAAMTVGLPNDTHPKIEALLIEGYRKMSPSQKLERVGALTRAVQELALMDVRRRHPDADSREQALRVASRWLDADVMVRAFGWDVREIGY